MDDLESKIYRAMASVQNGMGQLGLENQLPLPPNALAHLGDDQYGEPQKRSLSPEGKAVQEALSLQTVNTTKGNSPGSRPSNSLPRPSEVVGRNIGGATSKAGSIVGGATATSKSPTRSSRPPPTPSPQPPSPPSTMTSTEAKSKKSATVGSPALIGGTRTHTRGRDPERRSTSATRKSRSGSRDKESGLGGHGGSMYPPTPPQQKRSASPMFAGIRQGGSHKNELHGYKPTLAPGTVVSPSSTTPGSAKAQPSQASQQTSSKQLSSPGADKTSPGADKTSPGADKSSTEAAASPGMSLYERARHSAVKREEQARAFRETQYSFRPKLSTLRRRSTSHGGVDMRSPVSGSGALSSPTEAVQERLYRQALKHNERRREDEREGHRKSGTFTPKITPKARILDMRAAAALSGKSRNREHSSETAAASNIPFKGGFGGEGLTGESRAEQLYLDASNRREALSARIQNRKNDGCTFKPNITEKAARTAKNDDEADEAIDDRLYRLRNKQDEARKAVAAQMEDERRKACPFKPELKSRKKQQSVRQRPASAPRERTSNASAGRKPRVVDATTGETESRASRASFLERVEANKAAMEQRLAKAKAEREQQLMKGATFQPQLATSRRFAAKHCGDPDEGQENRNNGNSNIFSPSNRTKSALKEGERNDIFDRLHSTRLVTDERLREMRRVVDPHCTFTPTLHASATESLAKRGRTNRVVRPASSPDFYEKRQSKQRSASAQYPRRQETMSSSAEVEEGDEGGLSLFERLHQDWAIRQAKQRLRGREVEDKELEGCTFQPLLHHKDGDAHHSIIGNGGGMGHLDMSGVTAVTGSSGMNSASSHDVFERLNEDRTNIHLLREEMKRQLELSDCTFQPRLGRRPDGAQTPVSGDEGSTTSEAGRTPLVDKPVFERLLAHRTDYARLTKAKEVRELEGCTFKPDISLSKENSNIAIEASRQQERIRRSEGGLNMASIDDGIDSLGDSKSMMSPQSSSIFDRLRAEAEVRKEREILRERMRFQLEKEGCTFQPELVARSTSRSRSRAPSPTPQPLRARSPSPTSIAAAKKTAQRLSVSKDFRGSGSGGESRILDRRSSSGKSTPGGSSKADFEQWERGLQEKIGFL